MGGSGTAVIRPTPAKMLSALIRLGTEVEVVEVMEADTEEKVERRKQKTCTCLRCNNWLGISKVLLMQSSRYLTERPRKARLPPKCVE